MTIGEFSGVTGISAYMLRYIKHYSDLRYQGDVTIEERMNLLARYRETVLEEQKKWKEYLDNLDKKIKIYRERIV